MAEIKRYVDTGAVAGGNGTTAGTANDGNQAYQTLGQWEAATQQDLTDGGGDFATVHCNRTNGGGVDQAACFIYSWVTGASNYIEITADDFPEDGKYDSTKYVIENNDDGEYAISVCEDYVRIRKLQILATATGTNIRSGILFQLIASPSSIIIDSCIFVGACTTTGYCRAIYCFDADATVTIYNSVFYGFLNGESIYARAIMVTNGTVNIYNCTIAGNYYGILQAGGTITAKNCAIFKNTNDIDGTITLNYCATDDGDDTGNNGNITITQSADDWAALVTDAAGGDFSVTDTSSELYDAGTADLFTEDDDIIDVARPEGSAWDIGAFEWEVVGEPATFGQVIMIGN